MSCPVQICKKAVRYSATAYKILESPYDFHLVDGKIISVQSTDKGLFFTRNRIVIGQNGIKYTEVFRYCVEIRGVEGSKLLYWIYPNGKFDCCGLTPSNN